MQYLKEILCLVKVLREINSFVVYLTEELVILTRLIFINLFLFLFSAYGYSQGPYQQQPRQELTPIPPSYSQHA